MPRCRGARNRYRNNHQNFDHGYTDHPIHHHGVEKRSGARGNRRNRRANISSSALRRMVLNNSTNTQENLVILSTFYRRYEDGTCYTDGHSYWSYQRRAQLINSCFADHGGRFNLGVHTRRFLAISELAEEFMVPREPGGWGAVVVPAMLEHSIINEEMYSGEDEYCE